MVAAAAPAPLAPAPAPPGSWQLAQPLSCFKQRMALIMRSDYPMWMLTHYMDGQVPRWRSPQISSTPSTLAWWCAVASQKRAAQRMAHDTPCLRSRASSGGPSLLHYNFSFLKGSPHPRTDFFYVFVCGGACAKYELHRGARSQFLLSDKHDHVSVMFCRELVSPSQMTTATSITRIVANRQQYEARNAKKVKAENKYYSTQKEYVQEG